MRTLLLFFLFAGSISLYAQAEWFVIAGSDLLLLPNSAQIRPSQAAGGGERPLGFSPPVGFSIGMEIKWDQRTPSVLSSASVKLGTLVGGNITPYFQGSGLQQIDGDLQMGELFGQARLEGATYLQLGLGAQLFHFPKARSLRIGLGVGANLIVKERVHAATSWIDPVSGFAQAANYGPFSISDRTLVQDASPTPLLSRSGQLLLDQPILRRLTPYAELSASLQAGNRLESQFAIQVGLSPIIDREWYVNPPSGSTWVGVKFGLRGQVF